MFTIGNWYPAGLGFGIHITPFCWQLSCGWQNSVTRTCKVGPVAISWALPFWTERPR